MYIDVCLYVRPGKKTSHIWRGYCVSCGGDTVEENVLIQSVLCAILSRCNAAASIMSLLWRKILVMMVLSLLLRRKHYTFSLNLAIKFFPG